MDKYESLGAKPIKKQITTQSTKILKKGAKQKVSELQKKNILKAIGV